MAKELIPDILLSCACVNKILRIALFLITFSFACEAQNSIHGEVWNEVNFVSKSFKRNLFQFDLYFNTISDTQQVNLLKYKASTGLGGWYHFYPSRSIRFSVFGGWEHFNELEGQQPAYERFRLTFFANFNNRVNRSTFSHRVGLDHLWTQQEDNSYNSKYRLRYRFRVMCPLNKSDLVKGALYTFFTDEVFLNTQKRPFLLNQNRFQAALGYCINDDIQIEASYFYIYSPQENSSDITHVLQFSFVLNNVFVKRDKS